MKKGRKGFTLVELLAVIVVLAIILVIAVPKILDVINSARKSAFEDSAKLLISQAEKNYLIEQAQGNEGTLSYEDDECGNLADLSANDYGSCAITLNSDGKVTNIELEGAGKFAGYTCEFAEGTVTCQKGSNDTN